LVNTPNHPKHPIPRTKDIRILAPEYPKAKLVLTTVGLPRSAPCIACKIINVTTIVKPITVTRNACAKVSPVIRAPPDIKAGTQIITPIQINAILGHGYLLSSGISSRAYFSITFLSFCYFSCTFTFIGFLLSPVAEFFSLLVPKMR
jgi:hypothetical protein